MKKSMVMVGCGLAFVLSSMGQNGDPAKLIGTKKCAMCHKKDETGNQYGVWQSKAHSKAYEMLAGEEAKAVGAKLGIDNPQTSGKCLKCHSTAYFFTETVQNAEFAVEDGVSCESCHGPGADYKKKTIMENHDEAVANGMVADAKTRCVLCHNDTSPTWKSFDVAAAYEKIKHENPAK
jgi:Zn finger protein HypA/HybF involved in hydrogenase expression